MLQFSVVLVEPENPHNVGFVARAMCANALTYLRIVHSSRDTVSAASYRTAHASKGILDQAKVVSHLKEAVADAHYTIAFSRRIFESVIPVISLPKIESILPNDGKVALIFGRESKGLLLEEVNQCAHICEIPMPGNRSLNLGQAVSVVLYELSRLEKLSASTNYQPFSLANARLADAAQMEKFISFLESQLTARYKKKRWFQSSVRTLLQRLHPTVNELNGLFGISRSLSKSSVRKDKENNPI